MHEAPEKAECYAYKKIGQVTKIGNHLKSNQLFKKLQGYFCKKILFSFSNNLEKP
mgnify:FL=1|jgi:hypothetical protein